MSRAGAWIVSALLAAAVPLSAQRAAAQQGSAGHEVVMRVVGVSLLRLDSDAPIDLILRVPLDGASMPISDADSSKRLFYTVTTEADSGKKIQVRLDGSVPPGTALSVEAVAAMAGIGRPATRPLTLTDTDQTIVAGIGSCATGRSAADGVGLRYVLFAVDPARLVLGSTASARIIYTLTEE